MKTAITQEIIQRLHALDEPKLQEVLDFVEFLSQRERVALDIPLPRKAGALKGRISIAPDFNQPLDDPEPLAPSCQARGAMQGMLSSVDEFSARKEEEQAQEEPRYAGTHRTPEADPCPRPVP